jgi:class 3 adenylate cyclase/pimeloyl-ACP methyl ester carboxylesterase
VQPEIKYANSGRVKIAYQVLGEGPRDLVYVTGWVSHLEHAQEEPGLARFYRRLASFSRLMLFDKRGTGLSDRVPDTELPTLEVRMDDLRAVMDAAGSERAAVFGTSEGGPMSALFAATYPERTTALIMYGSYATRVWEPEYPWAPTSEERQAFYDVVEEQWGGVVDLQSMAPSLANDAAFRERFASFLRRAASPGAAVALARMNTQVDIRSILPAIRVPTLLIHRTGDLDCAVEGSRYMAQRIANARYVELPGNDHIPWIGDQDAILDEIAEFLTGVRHQPPDDRALATVLFSDIVGSTELARTLGDRGWKDLLERHHALVRSELVRFRGSEVDTAGDGFFATFDGPARAIHCACAIREAVRSFGISVRVGLHTGECVVIGGKVGGMAVHIGARVASHAAPGEVLVSSTVKDLVAGSGLRFEDRGAHALKGVDGEWRLYAVTG